MSAQSDRFRVLHRLTEIRFEDELRGYSKNQVDRVLETLSPLAQDVEQLQDKLAAAERRIATAEARLLEHRDSDDSSPAVAITNQVAPVPSQDFDETLRNTLVSAQQTADTMVREAAQAAELTLSSAQDDAEELTRSSQVKSDRLLAEGENARAIMFAEVEGERHSMLAAARDRATVQIEGIESELETVHAVRRKEILDQIGELEQVRDLLADDIENFEGHMAERRETVRTAMSEISMVLDDPERLRPAIPPLAADIGTIHTETHEISRVELLSLAVVDDELAGSTADETAPGESEVSETDLVTSNVEANDTAPLAGLDQTQQIPLAAPGDGHQQILDDSAEVSQSDPGIDLTDKAMIGSNEQAKSFFGHDSDDQHLPSDDSTASAPTSTPGSGMRVSRSLLIDAAPVGTEQESVTDSEIEEDVERPAWADAVPDTSTTGSADPFLDELRKVTTTESDDDDALSRFMNQDSEEPTRGGWFGRRR